MPGRADKTASATIKYICAAPTESQFTSTIQEFIDELDLHLGIEISPSRQYSDNFKNNCFDTVNVDDENKPEILHSNQELSGDFSECIILNNSIIQHILVADDRTSTFWPLRNIFYLSTVHSVNESGIHVNKYGDDDEETLNLNDQKWWFDQSSTLQASTSKSKRTFLSKKARSVIQYIYCFWKPPVSPSSYSSI